MKTLFVVILSFTAATVSTRGSGVDKPLETLLSLYDNDLAKAHRAVLACKASSGASLVTSVQAPLVHKLGLRGDLSHYYCSRLEMEIELETRRLGHTEIRAEAEKVIAAKPPLPGQSSPGSKAKGVSPVWVESDGFSLSDFFRVHAVGRVPAAFPGAARAAEHGEEDSGIFAANFLENCGKESGFDFQSSRSIQEMPLAALCPETLASGVYRPLCILAGDYLQRASVRQAMVASGRKIPGKGVDLAAHWPSMTVVRDSGILHSRQVRLRCHQFLANPNVPDVPSLDSPRPHSNRVNFHTLVSVPVAGRAGVVFTLWPEQHWLYRYHRGASSLGEVPRAPTPAAGINASLVNIVKNTTKERNESRGQGDDYESKHYHHDYHHHFPGAVRSMFGDGSTAKATDEHNSAEIPLAHIERAQKYEMTLFAGDAMFIPSGFSYAWTTVAGTNESGVQSLPPIIVQHSYVDASNVAAVREELAHEALLSPIYLETLHALQVLHVRELKTPRQPPIFLSWAAYRGEESFAAAKTRKSKRGRVGKPTSRTKRRSHRSWKVDKAWDSFVLSLALPAPVGVTVSDVGRRRARVCWSLP